MYGLLFGSHHDHHALGQRDQRLVMIVHQSIHPIMPLQSISSAPVFITDEQHAIQQSSTPTSFANLPPLLRFHTSTALVRIDPNPFPSTATDNGGNNGLTNGSDTSGRLEAVGNLWVTEKELSFLPTTSASQGFTIDYPSISMHAVMKASFHPGSDPVSCLYCQLDDDPDGEEDEQQQETDGGLREMWIFLQESNDSSEQLDSLFNALSLCSSLHPSTGVGEEGEDGHPFSGLGPFGTGLGSNGNVEIGAFDDADEEELPTEGEQQGEEDVNATGRVRNDFQTPYARYRPY